MKLNISKTPFEIILSNFQNFLEKRNANEITSHILLECNGNELTLKATDYELSIQSKIEASSVESAGKATANGRNLLSFIKNLKEGDITLETEDNNLLIKQGRSKLKLQMYNADEFPNMPEIDQSKLMNIESRFFLNAIKKVISNAESNIAKPEIGGILVSAKENNLYVVATDTRRLSIVKSQTQSEDFSIILPKRAIAEIQRLFTDDLEIYYSDTKVIVKSNRYTFFSKLISGKYPDFEKIVPVEFKYSVQIQRDKFVESARVVSSISEGILKISFEPNKIKFESMNNKTSDNADTEMDMQTGIENFSFGINPKHLNDFLNQVSSESFKCILNEPTKPIIFEDGDFKTIIMPLVF